MKLRTIYDLIVKKGMLEDQRPKSVIQEQLRQAKKEYRKARGADRAAFDKESTRHPYADTRILNGTGE